MDALRCTADAPCRLARRHLLHVSTAAVASTVLLPRLARADALTAAEREKLSADDILAKMRRGNDRFVKGERKQRNYLREQQTSAKEGQHPAAVLLSCIDSRAPAEVIMDLGLGDIFNARVAGNVLNDDITGSMEFATKVAGAKVILVMGHTACGAVKGAIDGAELGNLTQLLAKIRPAVEATTYSGSKTSKDAGFVDAVARKNVELTMGRIRETSAVIRELEAAKKVKIAGAMYDLATAKIDFFS